MASYGVKTHAIRSAELRHVVQKNLVLIWPAASSAPNPTDADIPIDGSAPKGNRAHRISSSSTQPKSLLRTPDYTYGQKSAVLITESDFRFSPSYAGL